MVIQRDPHIKSAIRAGLMDLLFDKPTKQIKQKILDLTINNAIKMGLGHASFVYKGQAYSTDASAAWPRPSNQLARDLRPTMDSYLEALADLDREAESVSSYVTRCLNKATTARTLFRFLPESVHASIQEKAQQLDLVGLAPLPEEEILKWLREHSTNFGRMRQRMALNLLLT